MDTKIAEVDYLRKLARYLFAATNNHAEVTVF